MQIVYVDDVFHGRVTKRIGRSVNAALFETTAGNPQRERMPIVIASVRSLGDNKKPRDGGLHSRGRFKIRNPRG